MIPPRSTEVVDWRCPTGRCEHDRLLHDGDGYSYDEERARCAVDGCPCGNPG